VAPILAPDPFGVIESVIRSLRHPFAIPNDRVYLRAIAGEHHYVEIAVSLLRQECLTLGP
jgi:hypothetical protein